MRLLLRTWPETQTCPLTGNRTSDPLVSRLALNPLSHTSQSTWHTSSNFSKIHLMGVSFLTLSWDGRTTFPLCLHSPMHNLRLFVILIAIISISSYLWSPGYYLITLTVSTLIENRYSLIVPWMSQWKKKWSYSTLTRLWVHDKLICVFSASLSSYKYLKIEANSY